MFSFSFSFNLVKTREKSLLLIWEFGVHQELTVKALPQRTVLPTTENPANGPSFRL